MKKILRVLSLSLTLVVLPVPFVSALDTASNPATEKFRQDMKAAVMNGSITIPQVKELQTNAESLKSARAEQKPGAPVDLLTPFHAVSNMRAIMATVKPQDREILEQDLQAMLANQHQQASAAAAPPSAGQKLGKDIFMAVMHGKPTDSQVKQLQDSLNSLQELKSHQGGPLQSMMTLKKSKSQIEEVMDAGSFRPQDRQAVLEDLNNLGPQGGGGGLRRGRG